mgnify:CR=1 FL=1
MKDDESKAEGRAWLEIANQNSALTNKSSKDSTLMTDEFRMHVDAQARKISLHKRTRSNSNMLSDLNQSVGETTEAEGEDY